jgi:signal transduction histidine kinase
MADMLVLPGLLRQLAPRSLFTVPLVARGRAEGAMILGVGEARVSVHHGEHALRAAREIAVLAALALDNARLYEAERQARVDAEKARAVAEQANRSKADFLGTMSHELRTPLNAIAGYVELLQLGVHGTLAPEQRRDLERIARNQHHVTNLLSDVLNFARLEAGRVQFECRRVQVAALLHDLEGLVPPGLVARKDDLRIRPCGDALSVWTDPDRTMQVLLNLVTNALKHTPANTLVEVQCDESPLAARLPFVSIRVRDEGQGIPADKLDAIFEPFVQASRRKAGSREGLGLGLAIARDLSRGMGGDLTVESQLGRGSTFTLTLPRRG